MRIGIDLGGSHISIGIVENGKIIEKRETDLLPENKSKDKIEKYIIESIEDLKQRYSIEKIGIAVPGSVKNGVIKSLTNLRIENWDLKVKLEKQFNIPVDVENDAKCAGQAEKEYGNLKQYEDCVFICLGSGIGGTVFLEGKQLKPKRNTGFELGHMIIQKDGLICNCGKKGCFETYCSIKRLKNKIISVLNLSESTTGEELIKQIEMQNNNEKLKNIIQEYIENLLVGISNIIDIFEPQAICLGGSFSYFENILFTPFLKIYEESNYVFNKEKLPTINLALLKNDAGVIGATI